MDQEQNNQEDEQFDYDEYVFGNVELEGEEDEITGDTGLTH